MPLKYFTPTLDKEPNNPLSPATRPSLLLGSGSRRVLCEYKKPGWE